MSQSEEWRWGWKLEKAPMDTELQSQVQVQIKMVKLVNIVLPNMIVLPVSMAIDLFFFEVHQNWFYTILHLLKFGKLLL